MMSEYQVWNVSYRRHEMPFERKADTERAIESYLIVAETFGEAVRKANKQFRSDSYRKARLHLEDYEPSVEPFPLKVKLPEFTLPEDRERFEFTPDWISADSLEFIVAEKKRL